MSDWRTKLDAELGKMYLPVRHGFQQPPGDNLMLCPDLTLYPRKTVFPPFKCNAGDTINITWRMDANGVDPNSIVYKFKKRSPIMSIIHHIKKFFSPRPKPVNEHTYSTSAILGYDEANKKADDLLESTDTFVGFEEVQGVTPAAKRKYAARKKTAVKKVKKVAKVTAVKRKVRRVVAVPKKRKVSRPTKRK